MRFTIQAHNVLVSLHEGGGRERERQRKIVKSKWLISNIRVIESNKGQN